MIDPQMLQGYTAYAAMIPALIQRLVVSGALPASEAAKLFRETRQLLVVGPASGEMIDALAARLEDMAAQMEALP